MLPILENKGLNFLKTKKYEKNLGDIPKEMLHIRETHFWTTKNGKAILIKKIGDIHLENIIFMLSKNINKNNKWLKILKFEKELRKRHFIQVKDDY